jgi:transcriptional regulator with XRE-family HTH domain
MKFGENLKLIRNDKKISQEDLAERLGVSRQSVSKWETGENYPSMQNIMALCTIFKCKINELVHEDFTDINFLDEEIKMSVVKFKEEKQNKVKGLSKAISIIAIIGRIICYVGLFFIGIAIILAPIIIKNVNVEGNKIVFTGPVDSSITLEENEDKEGSVLIIKHNGATIVEEKNQYSIMTIKTALQNNSKTKLIVLSETALAFAIINLVLVSIVLLYLERLFKNISSGDTPFTMDNVRYIKKMAYLMIAVIVLPSGGGLLAQFITGMDLDLDFEMFNVIEILFLFSLAYIFEYGYLIQLDSKGKMYGDENE